MTRKILRLAVALALVGCSTRSQITFRDAGPVEPTRHCSTEADCRAGERCSTSWIVPIPHCRPGGASDAGHELEDGGWVAEEDAQAPDGGVDASVPPDAPGCWVNRSRYVGWTLISSSTECGVRPLNLATEMQPVCRITLEQSWSDGSVRSGDCERTDGTHCTVGGTTFEGEALFRVTTLGDEVTQTIGVCVTTWQATAIGEGEAW